MLILHIQQLMEGVSDCFGIAVKTELNLFKTFHRNIYCVSCFVARYYMCIHSATEIDFCMQDIIQTMSYLPFHTYIICQFPFDIQCIMIICKKHCKRIVSVS